MAHKAEIAHHVRGRIRMKVPSAKGDEGALAQIAEALKAIPGVHGVAANTATGSVVVEYDPHCHFDFHQTLELHGKEHLALPQRAPVTEADELANTIEEEAKFLAEHSHVARAIIEFCKAMDRGVKQATGNAIDLKVLFPLGLAVYTFLELGFEAATPVWLTLGFFSLNHFVDMHSHSGGDEATPPEASRRQTTPNS
jgi:cation transport ATPase